MNYALKMISGIGLSFTVVPAFLVFMGEITWELHALLMLIGTVLWFASAPFWMKEKREESYAE